MVPFKSSNYFCTESMYFLHILFTQGNYLYSMLMLVICFRVNIVHVLVKRVAGGSPLNRDRKIPPKPRQEDPLNRDRKIPLNRDRKIPPKRDRDPQGRRSP